MIEPMKKITVLTQSGKRNQLILALREFGLVHIDGMVQKSEKSEDLEKDKSVLLKVVNAIEPYVDKKNPAKEIKLSLEEVAKVKESLSRSLDEENRLADKVRSLSNERDRIQMFGDFDPKAVAELAQEGIELHIYTVGKKELKALALRDDVKYLKIKTDGKVDAVATIGSPMPSDLSASEFVLPAESLGELEAEILSDRKRIEEIHASLKEAVAYLPSFRAAMKEEDEEIVYEKVTATAEDADAITYISGYLPAADADAFKAFCAKNSLAYLMDDPSEDENPPTKMKHKGVIRIIQPLFDMLGLVPGYREKDISLWFLAFMTLFFAMIVGDAGYGLLFILLAAGIQIKSKKLGDFTALIYVFGVATLLWGALTGTWFGSETIISKVKFLQLFVVKGLTNFPEVFSRDSNAVQNNMMTLCFSIGVIHLSLACVICIISKMKEKDLSLFSDLGWLINTCLLYLLVLYLVVNVEVPFKVIIVGVVIGFLLVCCFSQQAPGKPFAQGLKESLGGFFTTFINTISCFSNVMSYIRLFAVGMASLAIAQSFNGMAAGMLSGFALPAGVLILIIGHAVNLVMGLLSIVVHGVRLNIMEFSGQVGVEWSGYKYEPFRRKGTN